MSEMERKGSFSPFPGYVAPAYSGEDFEWTLGHICMTFGLATLSLITVLGNALILIAIATSRTLRAMPFSIFLVNMAVTDLLVGAVLDSLWGVFSVYGAIELDNGAACHIYLGLEYLISFATPSGLLAIAADRAWEAYAPAHHLRHNSRRCAVFCVFISWLYPLMFWLPAFSWDRIVHPYHHGDCFFDHGGHVTLTYVLAGLGYLLPVLLALTCYFITVYSIFWRRWRSDIECDEAETQRARLATIFRGRGGFALRHLSLFAQQSHDEENESSDSASEVSELSDEDEIRDLVFFSEFTDAELAEARFEHHLERRSFYLLTAKLTVYLCSWTPYFVTFLGSADPETHLSPRFVLFSVWNTYINAAVNPLLTILSGEHVSIHIQNMAHEARVAAQKWLACGRTERPAAGAEPDRANWEDKMESADKTEDVEV